MFLRILPPVLLILVWTVFCAFLANRSCCGADSKTMDVPLLQIMDATTEVVSTNSHFAFEPTTSQLPDPLDLKLQKIVTALGEHLQNHPNRRLILTGLYTTNEKNINSELGLERARAIESYLLNLGVPAIQIMSKQDMNDQLQLKDGQLQAAITFDFEAMPDKDALLEEMKMRLSEQKITLHFDLAAPAIVLTPAQRKYLEDLRYFLKDDEQQKVSVIGYTDDQGEARENVGLGRERASFVKDYMIELGFNRDNIITNSRGEADSISTNLTAEGRAKNRRVEIELLKETTY